MRRRAFDDCGAASTLTGKCRQFRGIAAGNPERRALRECWLLPALATNRVRPGLEEKLPMTSMDRRSLLTAMLGACVAAGAIGAAASSAMAVPLAPPVKPEADKAEVSPEVEEGEASLHNAQYFVVRRRARRRWFWRPIRRRRRVYFY
jgi:hypothetical protein